MTKKLCCVLYLKNHTSYDLHSWYTYGKKIKSLHMLFLHNTEILYFGVSSGVKEQKMVQNDKKLSVALCISESIHHIIVIFGTHFQNDDISRCFFHFFKMLILWVVRVLKGQKTTNLYLYISRTVAHVIKYTSVNNDTFKFFYFFLYIDIDIYA